MTAPRLRLSDIDGHRQRAELERRAGGYPYPEILRVVRAYGVSLEEAADLLRRAGGPYEACGGYDVTHTGGRQCIDHDHATNVVRGVLCNRCNRIVGMAKDDAARLRRIADYLERPRR